MDAVRKFANAGGPVLGICNGFQVLLEAGMLPGAMLRNRSVKFVCEHVIVKVEQTDTPFTLACRPGQTLRIPIAHGEGNYYADADVIARLEKNRQIIFRAIRPAPNRRIEPNGSVAKYRYLRDQRNVVGLMPHPERV
jgi:phosphoribosylformylglycinamidine synthase